MDADEKTPSRASRSDRSSVSVLAITCNMVSDVKETRGEVPLRAGYLLGGADPDQDLNFPHRPTTNKPAIRRSVLAIFKSEGGPGCFF
jgi:hypothetical protein